MWSYILSFFWTEKNKIDLSLVEACGILNTPDDPIEVKKEICSNSYTSDNTVTLQTGTITGETNLKYIIDSKFSFDKGSETFPVGARVSYSYYMCNSKLTVVNVHIDNGEWDVQDTQSSMWYSKVLICKVEKRDGRKFYLSPVEITLDLDAVCLEFLPMVGDWLEIHVKCTVDEGAIDLTGKILEIDKVSPLRHHIVTGKISTWNADEQHGTIDRNIYFNKFVLHCGYVPILGDRVIAQVVESEQNRCVWRALTVIPEYITTQKGTLSKESIQLYDFKDHHNDLRVLDVQLNFEKPNVTKEFIVEVCGESQEEYEIQSVKFPNDNSQCKVICLSTKTVSKNSCCKIKCQCTAYTIGDSKEFLLITLKDFNLGKWISINVNTPKNKITTSFQHKNYNLKDSTETTNIVKGQQVSSAPRFRAVHLPDYTVPKRLLSVLSKYDYRDMELLIEELKVTKSSLFSNLSYTNYENKFHTLLHLDEIAALLAIQMYDQERACFIQNGEFLMLEIENLSERRPSIILGDRIVASDPLKISSISFEGIVHKVTARHLHIKFSPMFHDRYNGEDYSIRVIPGRNTYRRLHHAVYLAARNLGPEILFPMRFYEKDPQVSFTSKIMTELGGDGQVKQLSHFSLEWYNKNLNKTQKNAVINILLGKARPLPYIIFGPPGTGKTVTVVETILQILRHLPQSRLLVAAPSNSAADLIALRLICSGVLKPGDLVRLVSFNYALSDLIPVPLVPYCMVGSAAREDTVDFRVNNGVQIGCYQSTLGRHRITVSTCSSTGQLYTMGFPKGHFTHIIVDEAAQASEPDVMIPLSFLDKTNGHAILAGDPMQLGPVILSKISSQYGLAESYLERLISRFPYIKDFESFPDTCGYDPRLATKLLYNYRSLPPILNMFSLIFYNNELISTIDNETSEEACLLKGLNSILPKTKSKQVSAVVFHGVDGENYQGADSPSWYNPYEAAQIFYYVNELYRLGVKSSSIGIITPYIKQVQEIRSLLIEAEFVVPKIGTVEEFQGQEFDVILLSTVRSREEYLSFDIIHKLGFVADPKRLNVAVSRAKSLLVIVGNPNVLCQDAYWRSVVRYCIEKGCYVGCDFSI